MGRNAAATAESLAKDNNVVLSNPLSSVITYPSDQLFNFQSVTCTEVQRIIMAMPSNKSPGPDKIGMRVFRLSSNHTGSSYAYDKLLSNDKHIP